MKSFFKIALSVVALSFVQPASASTQFTITGSTAFRGALYDTIVALMGGTPASDIATCKITTTAANGNGATPTAAQGHAAVNAAGTVTFQGSISGVNGGSPITIYVALSGSATGLISIFNSSVLNYAPANATTAGYNNVSYSATANSAPGAVQFSMSDIYASSVTTTKVTGLSEALVAVVPFEFVASRGSSNLGNLNNITAQNARLLFNNGVVQQAYLTGIVSDTNNVYLTGRDNGSGTRITVLAETKFGIANLVKQYYGVLSGTAGSGTITSLRFWPTDNTNFPNADTLNAGNGGYGSGGGISSFMGFSGAGTVNILNADGSAASPATDSNLTVVGYVGAGDAVTSVANGGKRLTYDGNLYDGSANAIASVQNGGYSLWCYEHLSYKGTPTGDEATLITKIKGAIGANLGVNGIDVTSMNITRAGDGGLIGP